MSWEQLAVPRSAGGLHNLSAQLLLTSRTVRNWGNGFGGPWELDLATSGIRNNLQRSSHPPIHTLMLNVGGLSSPTHQ